MSKQTHDQNKFWLSDKNKHFLLVISCLVPAIYFIAVFLFFGLYIPVLGCLAVVALFLIFYRKPMKHQKFKVVFCEVLIYAYSLELLAAFYLEWEMGFQNLLFALIPLCFSYLYLDNNYDQVIPYGIRYSIAVVLCYLLCDAIDYIVVPVSGATHLEVRFISGITSIITISMTFVYVIVFVIELYSTHQKLIEETNSRLNNLRSSMLFSQIKPHFIYNTLGAIEEMIDTDPARAKNELETFARYLRMNIDTLSSEQLITFDKELSHIKSYIQIQNLRYGDTLSIDYEIFNTDFKIPPLTIQPIVENAFKHGIRPKGSKGKIKLIEYETEDCYIIKVIDDGVGINLNTTKEPTTSTGLVNINYRVEKLCNGSLDMTSQPGQGTTVTVTIPKVK